MRYFVASLFKHIWKHSYKHWNVNPYKRNANDNKVTVGTIRLKIKTMLMQLILLSGNRGMFYLLI